MLACSVVACDMGNFKAFAFGLVKLLKCQGVCRDPAAAYNVEASCLAAYGAAAYGKHESHREPAVQHCFAGTTGRTTLCVTKCIVAKQSVVQGFMPAGSRKKDPSLWVRGRSCALN